MISVNTIFFVFICIFAVIGALLFLLTATIIIAIIVSGIVDCFKAKKTKENNCPYEIEGEEKHD